MNEARVEVRAADPSAPESLALIKKLWGELDALYPEADAAQFQTHEIAGERSGFVLAWLQGAAVGCGAFRPLPESGDATIAEIKRMYVAPEVRRHGIARDILRKLEESAAASAYDRILLETGARQPHAIRLYESAGYRRIAPYGAHANDPLSVCFEKQIH